MSTEARQTLLKAVTEAGWQGFCVSLAALRGWKAMHIFDSRRSNPGWPDLVLVRDGRLVFAELKREGGKQTAAQEAWLAELDAVADRSGGAVSVHLWRPSDQAEVEEVLR